MSSLIGARRQRPLLVLLIFHLDREQSRLMCCLGDRLRVVILSRRHGCLVDAIIGGLVDLLRTSRELVPHVFREIGQRSSWAPYCCALSLGHQA